MIYRYEIGDIGEKTLYAEEHGFDDTLILRLILVGVSTSTGTYSPDEEDVVEFYKN